MTKHTLDQASLDISRASEALSSFFDETSLEEQARKSGFVVRNRSGLNGFMFLILNTLQLTSDPSYSLQDQCDWLAEHFGVHLSKQSLDARYNSFGVRFMRSCFERLLKDWICDQKIAATSNSAFGRILLRDSTTLQLPATMSAFYPSKNASKTGASLKIDYCFNYLDGQTHQLVLESGRIPDSKLNTMYEPDFQANDLIIKDLGYWNCGQFEQYDQKGVYFLSRLRADATLYDLAGQKIGIETFLPDDFELRCYDWLLGSQQVPVRVCIEKVPESVSLQRLEKLRKQAKSLKWNLSELKIKLCSFNLYVTNADSARLPASLIRVLYGLRWQIELLFKAWKSILALDEIKPMSVFRIEAMLYGRLILILLNNHLQSSFKVQIAGDESNEAFELSEMKATKIFKKS